MEYDLNFELVACGFGYIAKIVLLNNLKATRHV